MSNKARLSRLNNILIKYNVRFKMSNLGVPAVRMPPRTDKMIKCNNDEQKSRHKKITPIIFLPSSSSWGISYSATSLLSLPALHCCYPAGCSYTMPNGRPGTLIEISFLIEGTYLVVKAWKGRRGKRRGMQNDANEYFDFSPPVIFLQPLNLLFI